MTTTQCEHLEAEVSALLDGELTATQSLTVVDHLLSCDRCRAFYRGGRSLARALDSAQLASRDATLPDDLWQRIEAAARIPKEGGSAVVRFAVPWWRALVQVAAVCLIAVGGWWFGHQSTQLPKLPDDGIVRVAVEGNRGAMDDNRFLRLTTELLQADRQYHLKMHQILTAVNRQTFVFEGGREGPAAPFDEESIVRTRWSSRGADDPTGQQRTWY